MRGPLSAIFLALAAAFISTEATTLPYTGLNECGADFGQGSIPGIYNTDYTYPNLTTIDHFISKGVNIFRIPFLWERMQPTLGATIDATQFGYLDNVVQHITAQQKYALLDPHNFDKYNGNYIGSTSVTFDNFGNFWAQIAAKYKSNPYVVFGLMNEPEGQATETVLETMQTAINAIRAAGATNLITVPGNAYTGAWCWTQDWYGTANSQVMINITDPADNWVYEMHQYFDSDYSGTSATCVSSTFGSEKVAPTTAWLRSVGRKAFLGELGVAANDVCLEALDDLLSHLEANSDVWVGYTYWAAGPWWGTYMYSVEPSANLTDQPQWVSVLSKHVQTGAPVSSSTSKTTTSTTTTSSTSTTTSTSSKPTSTSTSSKSTSTSTSSKSTSTSSSTSTSTTKSTSTTTTASSTASSVPCASHWSQCGGIGWGGATCCTSPYTCVPQTGNPYYSQCL